MEDINRWKWFAIMAGFLPWLLFLFPQEHFFYVWWVVLSPLWTLIIVYSTINLYETFREGRE